MRYGNPFTYTYIVHSWTNHCTNSDNLPLLDYEAPA